MVRLREPVAAAMNRCKNFNGIQNDKCRAGVDYEEVTDQSVRPYKFACFQDDGCAVKCALAEFPTRTEAEAEVAESRKAIERMFKIRAAIVEATKGKRGVSGKVPCPACGNGTVGYSISRSNGHIHAACSTPNCAAWME